MTTPTRTASGLNEAVAGEIRAELARRQWSQVELATKLGVDQMWLSRRLRATKALTLTEFEAIAQVLDLSPAELIAAALGRTTGIKPPYVPGTVRPPDRRPKGRSDSRNSDHRSRQKRALTPEEKALLSA